MCDPSLLVKESHQHGLLGVSHDLISTPSLGSRPPKEEPPGTFHGLVDGGVYWVYVSRDDEEEKQDRERMKQARKRKKNKQNCGCLQHITRCTRDEQKILRSVHRN